MDKREKHQNRCKAQLREFEADIQNVRAMARRATADVQADSRERAGCLDEKLKTARKKADGVWVSSSDTWEELRKGLELTMGELKSGISDAWRALSPR